MRVRTDGGEKDLRAVWYDGDRVQMIDQKILPGEFEIIGIEDHRTVAACISDMTIRGAPSIGAAAAYGMMLAAVNGEDLEQAASVLKSARPTANDLFYAVDHMMHSMSSGEDPVDSAEAYVDSIVKRCLAIGEHGASLISEGSGVMTHCNAGALAAVDVGTALAPIRAAWERGTDFFVYVSETRPRMQGMKLTAWELLNEGIPHSIIVDGASGHFMKHEVDLIITGADRIVSNGDLANKIGTFEKAVIAKELNIPFYVAAPLSTFDFSIASGDDIPIESRGEEEITRVEGLHLAPDGSPVLNPAFDVTPHHLVTKFITEKGLLAPGEISRIKEGKDGF